MVRINSNQTYIERVTITNTYCVNVRPKIQIYFRNRINENDINKLTNLKQSYQKLAYKFICLRKKDSQIDNR